MKKKKMPRFKTDEELEAFLEQDLSPYLHKGNYSDLKIIFEPKSEKVNMRMTSSLLKKIKKRAKKVKMPYQRYMHHLLEHALAEKGTL